MTFVEYPVNLNRPRGGSVSVDAINAKATSRTSQERLASQRYVDSRHLQPDLEALMTGVKAAFRI